MIEVVVCALPPDECDESIKRRQAFADAIPAPSQEKAEWPKPRKPMCYDGYDMFQWPELHAFLKRCGVDMTLGIKSVSINIEEGDCPIVITKHIAADMKNEKP